MSVDNNSLPQDLLNEIDRVVAKFPEDQKQSAVIGALSAVQHHNKGFLTTELMDQVADYLQMPNIAVYEVASFYSMFETEPVGRNSISVCNNISCMLRGAENIIQDLENKLGVKTGESTPDNKFFLKKEEECLGACIGAPVMQINHKYFEKLSSEKLDEILAKFD